jgi:hypothetical protein
MKTKPKGEVGKKYHWTGKSVPNFVLADPCDITIEDRLWSIRHGHWHYLYGETMIDEDQLSSIKEEKP